MKRKSLLLLAATALVAMAFTACSETDNSANEFPNWQATNETYFASIYNVAKGNSA
ncbi:MAG: peptidylprolyl isomerase, partial [Prevotella shahii]|nr:peptidylprolyl isomerase [Hoylesella shahii]